MANLNHWRRRLHWQPHLCGAAEAGHELVVLDGFANSSPVALDRVAELTGRPVQLVQGDVHDAALLERFLPMPMHRTIHQGHD